MRDPCETCPSPFGSYQCLDCRFNEDNWQMPTAAERYKDEYWKRVNQINNQGVMEPGPVLRTVPFDESTLQGMQEAQTAADCASVMFSLAFYFDTVRRKSGVDSLSMGRLYDGLKNVFISAGYLQEVPYDPLKDDELPF